MSDREGATGSLASKKKRQPPRRREEAGATDPAAHAPTVPFFSEGPQQLVIEEEQDQEEAERGDQHRPAGDRREQPPPTLVADEVAAHGRLLQEITDTLRLLQRQAPAPAEREPRRAKDKRTLRPRRDRHEQDRNREYVPHRPRPAAAPGDSSGPSSDSSESDSDSLSSDESDAVGSGTDSSDRSTEAARARRRLAHGPVDPTTYARRFTSYAVSNGLPPGGPPIPAPPGLSEQDYYEFRPIADPAFEDFAKTGGAAQYEYRSCNATVAFFYEGLLRHAHALDDLDDLLQRHRLDDRAEVDAVLHSLRSLTTLWQDSIYTRWAILRLRWEEDSKFAANAAQLLNADATPSHLQGPAKLRKIVSRFQRRKAEKAINAQAKPAERTSKPGGAAKGQKGGGRAAAGRRTGSGGHGRGGGGGEGDRGRTRNRNDEAGADRDRSRSRSAGAPPARRGSAAARS